MHVMAISTISNGEGFDAALKEAYGRLPKGAKWILAVASSDGSRAVNIVRHDSVDEFRSHFEAYAGPHATTEYFEADAKNAVGLGK